MPIRAANVYLYAAVEGDYMKCLATADVCGIPSDNVLGDFSKAWSLIQNGSNMVIAVGGAALYALYYNPCGWSNPAGESAGHTPFQVFPSGQGIAELIPGYFVNAAGYNALDSLKLAVMLAYFAIHGVFPETFQGLPRQETPQHVCVRGASPTLTNGLPGRSAPPGGTLANTVGVYASFNSSAQVQNAIARGWTGIGHTAGLGVQHAPYTAVLSGRPDVAVANAISQTSGNVWWLSFWTVSWPQSGDTFYNAGYSAGKYAATVISGYNAKYIPNYVILDPEGYNQPARTASDWAEFIHGWTDGITSVNSQLKSGFYCNQSQYVDYNLNDIEVPAFIAISPISGNKPLVNGNNISGYIAYYGSCPVSSDILQMKNWGGKYNTIQFRDNGVDCGPV